MATVKIGNKMNNQTYEYSSLDKALRDLVGIDPKGYKYQQKLLTKPGLKTYRNALGLLEHNGYTLMERAKNVKGRKVRTKTKEEKQLEVQKHNELLMQLILSVMEQLGGDARHRDEHAKAEAAMKGLMTVQEAHKLGHLEATFNEEQFMQMFSAQIKSEKAKEAREKFEQFKNQSTEEIEEVEENEEAEEELKLEEKQEEAHDGKHYQFKVLLAVIASRVNALLVGPAGSGKTTAAEMAAKELGISYFAISVGMQTTKTEFFGYNDANGRYVRTLFREAYENGGVFLIDEMDAGNANVMTCMNQALANNSCAFPDGMVNKHNDFVIVASANTFGTGANREYVGRNQLDAATLDRFAVIEWNYDEKLERKLCSNVKWLEYVLKCRENASKHKIRTVVSPRASIGGAKMIAAGMKPKQAIDLLIRKGMNDTEFVKLTEGAIIPN